MHKIRMLWRYRQSTAPGRVLIRGCANRRQPNIPADWDSRIQVPFATCGPRRTLFFFSVGAFASSEVHRFSAFLKQPSHFWTLVCPNALCSSARLAFCRSVCCFPKYQQECHILPVSSRLTQSIQFRHHHPESAALVVIILPKYITMSLDC